MLPNLRFIAVSVLATVAIVIFSFGLFAAFRLANRTSFGISPGGETAVEQTVPERPLANVPVPARAGGAAPVRANAVAPIIPETPWAPIIPETPWAPIEATAGGRVLIDGVAALAEAGDAELIALVTEIPKPPTIESPPEPAPNAPPVPEPTPNAPPVPEPAPMDKLGAVDEPRSVAAPPPPGGETGSIPPPAAAPVHAKPPAAARTYAKRPAAASNHAKPLVADARPAATRVGQPTRVRKAHVRRIVRRAVAKPAATENPFSFFETQTSQTPNRP